VGVKRRYLAVLITAAAAALPFGVGMAATRPAGTVGTVPPPEEGVELTIFHGDGCPHCARMLEFLDDLQDRYTDLEVVDYEVWYDAGNQALFRETMAALGEEPRAVPTVIIGDRVYVGYTDAIAERIEAVVADRGAGRIPDTEGDYVIDVPLIGHVNVGSRSLVPATLLIAFVDGVNPCSLWVLSMLLALVVHSGSRSRVFAVGGLFLVVTSLLYGLYMLGAYSTLAIVGRQQWIRAMVALVAGGFGILHLKEHWTTAGPSVTIGAEHKPGIFRRMRRLADPDRSLPATLGGTAVLAVGVSLLETPCTAGLPLLWTDLVAERDVPISGVAFLFMLYLLVFLIDELVIFGAVVVTMRVAKMQEQHGQALQLIGGVLMLTLAVVMLFASHLLDGLGGTALVFGLAVGISAAVLAAEWWWKSSHQGSLRARS
jgi:cytochrome c biogenesis protein CcdA/glutaredoxin